MRCSAVNRHRTRLLWPPPKPCCLRRGSLIPPPPVFDRHLEDLEGIRRAALAAADPSSAVQRILHLQGDELRLAHHRLRLRGRLVLVALGKAALPMSAAAMDQLGGRVQAGLVAGPRGARAALPPPIEMFAGAHPLPDGESLAAGKRLSELLGQGTPDDLVLVLISGGGSAMLEHPVAGVTLADLRVINDSLLRSGLPISQVNVVRGALSEVKAGGLARMASPARVAALVVSDVPGDDLAAVASGPTVLTADRRSQARGILRRAGLWSSTGVPVRQALSAPRARRPRTNPPLTILIASNRQAARAALAAARSIGFDMRSLSRALSGEAARAGKRLARRLLRASPGGGFVAGGETTVTLATPGKGGRNQELALQASLVLDGAPQLALMAFATDGIDGPTDASGAMVTGATAGEIRQKSLDPQALLDAHNSYKALDAAGALIRTGPTGTNVADLVVGLKY